MPEMSSVASPKGRGPAAAQAAWQETVAARTLFWHNVMREILTSLSVESMRRPRLDARDLAEHAGEPEPAQASDDPAGALFDGRLAILTHAGERIPIAEVHPILSCGINTSDAHRKLSMAVECTVFQIRTPMGEIFTLPLHEIRGFHAVSPELMARFEQSAMDRGNSADGETAEPFGFAAFTSLARNTPHPAGTTGLPSQ